MTLRDLAFLPTPFELCEPEDDQFDKVKLILCNPPCSLASVACPVDYIMQEGGVCMHTHVQWNLSIKGTPNKDTSLMRRLSAAATTYVDLCTYLRTSELGTPLYTGQPAGSQ